MKGFHQCGHENHQSIFFEDRLNFQLLLYGNYVILPHSYFENAEISIRDDHRPALVPSVVLSVIDVQLNHDLHVSEVFVVQ